MSELRNLTRMGGDLRKIARLLQDKGRGGDTILAHINPREAALLREQGGSGEINPETGLMEFEDGLDFSPEQGGFTGSDDGSYSPEQSGFDNLGDVQITPEQPQAAGGEIAAQVPQQPQEQLAARGSELGATPTNYSLAGIKPPTALGETMAGPQAGPSQPPQPKGLLESLSGGDKTRLGLAGVQGLSTALMANKARTGAQKGAEQIRQVGAPYAQRGLAEQSAAQRGELTPVGQQQLDAMRARAAQAGVSRGGVGVAQQQRAEEDLRQRLNAARESFGLQLSQIGDKYTMDAIKAGMQADAEVNQLYNQMFGNLARIAAPAAIQAGGK